jgi:hypothetical protein
VTSVRRLPVSMLAGLLLLGGMLLPGSAAGHSGGAAGVVAPVSNVAAPMLSLSPIALRAQPPAPEAPWLLIGLAAGLAATSLRSRPRRALGVALIVLLVVLAAEHGIHSVHHLNDERQAAACAVAASVNHLMVALDDGAPVVAAPVTASRQPAENAAAPPLALRFGPDPSRAPPAPIA